MNGTQRRSAPLLDALDPSGRTTSVSRRRRSLVLVALAAIVVGFVCQRPMDRSTLVLGTVDEPNIDLGFPIGWYDNLSNVATLPVIASEGADSVMPYFSATADAHAYLDAARSAGVRVLLEIPRSAVATLDTAAIAAFVTSFKGHPALLGWYLADEPSINTQLGPLSPEHAATLYGLVKQIDPTDPVAMAFAPGENAAAYSSSMDVMMLDDYPSYDGRPEFDNLDVWTEHLDRGAATAAAVRGFVPVLQAYGGAFSHRLPTLAEERYMLYASVVRGATGVYFWTHYRSDPTWIHETLTPLVTELEMLRPALAEGVRADLVDVNRANVRAVVLRNPSTKATYLVVVHGAGGPVRARLSLRGRLARRHTVTQLGRITPRTIIGGRFTTKLGSYGVRVYRIT